MKRHYFWLSLVTIAALAMTVSFLIGMGQSIWFDEAYSIVVAQRPLPEIVRLVGLDTHPPLYYILVHGWGELFSWNTVALRLLSVIGFGGSIIMAGLLVRRLFGAKAAIASVGMIALSPLLIRYGFEIRMYSLASCIGVVATYAMVRAYQAKYGYQWWLVYAVLVALGMYTLYYLALLWLAHAVWLVWRMIQLKQQKIWYKQFWLRAYMGAVFLFLPWLPTFLRQTGNGALAPIGQPMHLENLMGILSFNSIYKPIWQFTMFDTIVFLGATAAAILLVRRAHRNYTKDQTAYLWLLIGYSVVPVLVLMAVSFVRPMYVERYLSHTAIAIPILLGVVIAGALSYRKDKVAVGGAGMIGAACIFGVLHVAMIGNYNFQRMSRPDVAQMSRYIAPCGERTAVIAADPYVAIELMPQMPVSCSIYFYSANPHLSGGYAPLNASKQQLTSQSVQLPYDTLYYVYYDTPQLSIEGMRQTATITSDNLHVSTYRN